MNKTIIFLIICSVVFGSCKKESNPLTPFSLSAPILVSPLNNSTNVPVSLLLIWNTSSGATTYNLKVALDEGFTNIITDQSKLSDTSYQVSGLINSTPYYWKVSAGNNNGISGWSGVWKFTTGLAPSTPILLSPTNNSTTIFMPVTFSWNASAGATDYALQVSTSSSFNSFGYNQDSIKTTIQQVSFLKPLTLYYWRVSAINKFGTSNWSTPVWTFITASGGNTGIPCSGIPTITYSDKTYHTVQIGNQCWLKENLDAGTMISGIQTNNNIIEKYCYQNDSTMCKIYGGLYQWDEAMKYGASGAKVQGICPTGWHLPDTIEFNKLISAVNNNGNTLKALWQGTGNGTGTDASGFSALLSGYRGHLGGTYFDLGNYTNFWGSIESDTTSDVMWLNGGNSSINQNYADKKVGFSVRCVKD